MSIESERERLSQARTLADLRHKIALTEMVTIYQSDADRTQNHGIYCALIPSGRIAETLAEPAWDLKHGGGLPGAIVYWDDDGNEPVEYLRYGNWHVEPLVIDCGFHGIREDYKEISEEFRLFHRLYHDRKLDQYIKIDDDGNEQLVAIVEHKRVLIRLKEIQQFLAIKEMYLSIQFDCREHSSIPWRNWGSLRAEVTITRGSRAGACTTAISEAPEVTKRSAGCWASDLSSRCPNRRAGSGGLPRSPRRST